MMSKMKAHDPNIRKSIMKRLSMRKPIHIIPVTANMASSKVVQRMVASRMLQGLMIGIVKRQFFDISQVT